MGKHYKKEVKQEAVNFSWDPMPDEFYKARIKTLEKENLKLSEKLTEKEKSIGVYEAAMDYQEVVQNGISSEYEDLLNEKDEEIAALKLEIKMLKEAVVKGALREVLA